MDLGKLPLFNLLKERMSWLNARQEVLAQNIANADTPDFTPHDLKPMDFRRTMQELDPVQPLRTNPAHLVGAPGAPQSFRDQAQRQRYETAPAGNSVVLEEQLIKVAETQMEYQMTTNLYRKHVDMLKAAIGRSGG